MYLKLAAWPWPSVIHYEISHLKNVAEAWPWLCAAGIYGIAALVLLWRCPAVRFVMLFVVAVLSPTLLIPLRGETAAERRMYVPLAGLIALFVVGGYASLGKFLQIIARKDSLPMLNAASTLTILAFVVGFDWLSAKRLSAYQSQISLWQDAIAHQPHNPLAQANLGIRLAEQGRIDEALPHFEEAIRLKHEYH